MMHLLQYPRAILCVKGANEYFQKTVWSTFMGHPLL